MKPIGSSLGLVLVLAFAASVPMFGCASPAPASGRAAAAAQRVKLPANVDVYATSSLGDAQTCVVGATIDAGGMNERPVVYLLGEHRIAWHLRLAIPKDVYQGRATHCTASPATVYVLVQVDTDSEQSTSQTLLRVVAIDRARGIVQATRSAEVPGVSAAYTAWVGEGGGNFRLQGDTLVIKGQYDLMSDRDSQTGKAPTPFTLAMPVHRHGTAGGAR